VIDELVHQFVGRGDPEDGVVTKDRAGNHLGYDQRIDVRTDLPALDPAPVPATIWAGGDG